MKSLKISNIVKKVKTMITVKLMKTAEIMKTAKIKYPLPRILCTLFMLFAVLPLLSITVFSEGEEAESLPYVSGDWLYLDARGGIAVCGYTGNEEHITIPEAIEGKTVKEITYNPFDNSGSFPGAVIEGSFFRGQGEIATKHITIPDTVKVINSFAFSGCSSLERVDLPQGLTDICGYAFADCYKLKKADLPEGIINIEESAFANTGITELYLPDTVKTIGLSAFSDTPITRVELPDSLTSLGARAFYGCEQLQWATLPSGLTEIPTSLFNSCFSLSSAEIPDTVKTIGENAFFAASLESVYLPQGLTEIGHFAFAHCSKLYKADIPDSVKTIGKYAFYDTAITKAELPDTLTDLGAGAFSACESLQSVRLPSRLTKIPSELFSSCMALGSAELPDTVRSVGSHAFEYCLKLEHIKLPSGLTEISDSAFDGCVSLKSIEIPDTVKYIGSSAFANCCELETVKLPAGITEIAPWTFLNCSSLRILEIPEGVSKIWCKRESIYAGTMEAYCPFEGCESLEEIHFPKSIRSVYNILRSNYSLKAVYFAADKETAEALMGNDIISVMTAADDSGTDYSRVMLFFGEKETLDITEEKTPLDTVKFVLKITSVIFAAAFLVMLALNLIQKAKTTPKKAEQGGNVLTRPGSSDMLVCKHCGMLSGKAAKYCTNCGKKLSK